LTIISATHAFSVYIWIHFTAPFAENPPCQGRVYFEDVIKVWAIIADNSEGETFAGSPHSTKTRIVRSGGVYFDPLVMISCGLRLSVKG